jgi:hypothetical protein
MVDAEGRAGGLAWRLLCGGPRWVGKKARERNRGSSCSLLVSSRLSVRSLVDMLLGILGQMIAWAVLILLSAPGVATVP